MDRKRWLVLAVMGVVVLVVLLVAMYKLIPRFEVVNNLPQKQFKINQLAGINLLWQMGYWPQVTRVKVVYTEQVQDGYELIDGNDNVRVQSGAVERDGNEITVYWQYSGEKIGEILDQPDWFETDLLAGICLAVEFDALGYDGCYQKAAEYVEKMKANPSGRIVSWGIKNNNWSFRLVKPVYAGCQGSIPCGAYQWTCSCSVGGSCQPSWVGEKCTYGGKHGVCGCKNACVISAGRYLNCGALGTSGQCSSLGDARSCATGCNNSGITYCRWVTPKPPKSGGYVPYPTTPPKKKTTPKPTQPPMVTYNSALQGRVIITVQPMMAGIPCKTTVSLAFIFEIIPFD